MTLSGHREQGWMNNPPRFSTKEKTMSMHANAPLGLINEREYEVVKTIGLLRET
jgi:hypothetical protein